MPAIRDGDSVLAKGVTNGSTNQIPRSRRDEQAVVPDTPFIPRGLG